MSHDLWKLPLNHTRANLQRLSDAKFFTGWIRHIDPHVVEVCAFDEWPLQEGDLLNFQLVTEGHTVTFVGKFASQVSPEESFFSDPGMEGTVAAYRFAVVSEPSKKPTEEEPRFHPGGYQARIIWKGDLDVDYLTVLNVSRRGMSIGGLAHVPKGEECQIEIPFEGDVIRATCEVRYCVRDRHQLGCHRLGLKILQMDRLSMGKWRQLYDDLLKRSSALRMAA